MRSDRPLINAEIERGARPTAERVARISSAERATLGADGVAQAEASLTQEVLGLGPLQPLVSDERVTDVLVNGAGGVWVDRGDGIERAEVDLRDEHALRRLAVRLAALAGQRLDDAAPFVDGLLPGGIRLHAVLPPLVEGAAHLSLRIPRRTPPGLDTLRQWGMFDVEVQGVLSAIVASRAAFVVGGGTGSGKTTLLSALLAQACPSERLVVVEDVREIQIDHPHVVHLQGRSANVEGRGEITLAVLIRQSLRMRPDRVVLGEARGAEVRELLTALNTGHEGGCGTIHANSAADIVSRFEALGALAGLSPAAVRTQMRSAFQIVVHVERVGPVRRLRDVGVIRARGDQVDIDCAIHHNGSRYRYGPAYSQLCALLGWGP